MKALKIFAFLLLACGLGFSQTTPDQDYTLRCGLANLRCVPRVSIGTLVNSPAGGLFPDGHSNNANIFSDNTTCASTCGYSTKIVAPGDYSYGGGTDLTYASFDYQPNTSKLSKIGTDFYIQYRIRMNPEYLLWQDGISGEANKLFIFNPSDRYVNANTWALVSGCSKQEMVMTNEFLLGYMFMYYSCGQKTISNNPPNGGAYEAILPQRGNDYISQTAYGCLSSQGADVNGVTKAAWTTATRTSNVVKVYSALSLSVGNWVWMFPGNPAGSQGTDNYMPVGNPALSTNTSFAGTYQVASVGTDGGGAFFTFNQTGIDQSVTAPVGGAVIRFFARENNTCWFYQPNEWTTIQVHMLSGRDYFNDGNLHRDSVVEAWGSHQDVGGHDLPSSLVLSESDYDLMSHDNIYGNVTIGNASPVTSPTALWWGNQGLYPEYGRLDIMQFESNRCLGTYTISNLARSAGGVASATLTHTQANGAGKGCYHNGDTLIVSGTATDGGSFNGTWTVTNGGTGGTAVTWAQAGNTVASTPASGTLVFPAYITNCNGHACDATAWYDQIIYSTHRIPDPKAGNATPVPDPPDHLVITSRNDTTGAVTLRWIDNDASTPTFKLDACADTGTTGGDRYQCVYEQGKGNNPWSTVQTGITASVGQYNYATTTWTPPTTCNVSHQKPGTGSNPCNAVVYSFRVKATNANGDSTYSNYAQNTAPQPTDVFVTTGSTSNMVTWVLAPPFDATTVNVDRCTANLNTTLASGISVNDTTVNVVSTTGLVAGYVVSVGTDSHQESYVVQTVVDATHYTINPAIAKYAYVHSIGEKVYTKWNSGTCSEFTSNHASWVNVASLSGTATSFLDTGVTAGGLYIYRVSAVNSAALSYTMSLTPGVNTSQSAGVTASSGPATEAGFQLGFAGNTAQAITWTIAGAADVTVPTVAVTVPSAGATVSGSSVTLTATCTDNVAVQKVLFRIDGIGYDTFVTGSSPYSTTWDSTLVPNGSHTVDAICIDTAVQTVPYTFPLGSQYGYGNQSTASAVSFTVNNAGGINPATCSVTSPTAGATVNGTITISGSCTPGQGTCTPGTQFTVDGVNQGAAQTGTTPSVSWNTNIGNGPHTLSGSCTDSGGGNGMITPVSVTVNNVSGVSTSVKGSTQNSIKF